PCNRRLLFSSFQVSVTISISSFSLHDALPILHRLVIQEQTYQVLYRWTPLQIQMKLWILYKPNLKISLIKHGLTLTASSGSVTRSEEHTSELQSRFDLVCRLLLEKTKLPTDVY